MTETEALLVLNMLPKIGPVRIRRMVDQFGSGDNALRAGSDQLRRVEGIGPETARILASWEDHADLSGETARIREHGLTVITAESPEYPETLRQIPDRPVVLYVRGTLKATDRLAIGVVGSRRATMYGLTCARKLSFQLAHAGITVLSGLARGIDTAAHEGALAAKGRTVAVIGSGLGRLYPPENQALADRIASGSGAVVSEFPILTEPDRQTFPQRNRIVSGWSQGVLVVEAPAWSGALITAENAAEQGRTVYAVPGQIDKPTSMGCNRLIQNGARLVVDAADIIDDMNCLLPPGQPAASSPAPAPAALTPEETAIWTALGTDEIHLDEVISATGFSTASVSSTLMRMELKRLVKQLPGRFYVKLV